MSWCGCAAGSINPGKNVAWSVQPATAALPARAGQLSTQQSTTCRRPAFSNRCCMLYVHKLLYTVCLQTLSTLTLSTLTQNNPSPTCAPRLCSDLSTPQGASSCGIHTHSLPHHCGKQPCANCTNASPTAFQCPLHFDAAHSTAHTTSAPPNCQPCYFLAATQPAAWASSSVQKYRSPLFSSIMTRMYCPLLTV